MSALLAELWLPLSLAFVAAGIIKGTFGIGLPTAAVGLMSQFTDPRTAIVMVVFPILVTNFWQMLRAGHFLRTLKRYRYFNITIIIVLGLTTIAFPYIPTNGLMLALGAIIVLFAITSLISAPPAVPEKHDKPAQFIAGTFAGVIGGLTSIWGPPMVIYLLARRVDKDEFVRALGTMLFLGGIPLAFGFWANGLLTRETAPASLLMVVPALIGFSMGEIIRQRIHADRFRTAVLLVFLFIGLNLLRRALF